MGRGKPTLKSNDVILQTVTKIVVFIILTFSVDLFLAGHHHPGGGFVGGLVFASAFVLLYLAFDLETVRKGAPFDFKRLGAFGALVAVATGLGGLFWGEAFLSQTLFEVNVPLLGELVLSTVTLFEAGVALTVIGVVVTIIFGISEGV